MACSPTPTLAPWRLCWLRTSVAAALALAVFGAQAVDLTVSAAASLTQAFRDLAPAFEARHPGVRVQFNFAASDALLVQIGRGAPVDVFASADAEAMDKAQAQQWILPGSRRNFVRNALVLVQPADSTQVLKSLGDLRQAEVRRVALGRPEGVPAGRYARGALEAAGVWPAIEPKAVYAIHVRQALDYVARGEVDAGFVYATDARVQQDKVKVAFAVPTAVPITYPIAAVAGGAQPEVARRFIDFLLSAEAQAVLARHGFGAP